MKTTRRAISFIYFALAVIVGGLAGGAALVSTAMAQPEVSGLRVGVHPDKTRLVIDLSEKVPFQVFTLAAPYRVVIDLPALEWLVPETQRDESGGLIKRLRYGLFQPETSRVVLDMAAPARVQRSFVLTNAGGGYRLVIDLEKTEEAAFMAQLRPPVLKPLAPPPPVVPPADRPGADGRWTIVLDAGHGGVDPGASTRAGVREKHITLAMARELKALLETDRRYKVVLTRDRDIFLRLRERVHRSRLAGADLFISLHADSIGNPQVAGLSVYTLSDSASDREAATLAARENKADLIAGVDLSGESAEVTDILIDLAQRETMNLSAHFAQLAIGELAKDVKLLRRTHRFAGFAVLKAPDVPSVLVELGYLSNSREAQNLQQPAYRQVLGKALKRAIDTYFDWKETLTRS